ncbi:MAG: cytochrome P450 [Ilumatobacteraceae bacterium]|nr:cytochrome P450 [Ilumatobacteraceae bacterium]
MTYSHLEHANDLEPAAGHHHLIEHCPLHKEDAFDPPFYVVSRHEDVLSMLTDPAQWTNGDGPGVFFQEGGVLGSADDPDHRRQRKVLQDGFRPAAIASLAPRVDIIGRELWDKAFASDGEGDFVTLFAFPFPAIVIAEMLGIRPEDREQFGHWSDDIVNGLGGGDLSLVAIANEGIYGFVDALVAERQEILERGETPPDDLLTVLTLAYRNGDLQYGEVRRLSQQVLVAGHETTASLLSLMLYRLIQQPELGDLLRADPSLIPWAVEEFLRYDSPVQGLFRTNRDECVVHGEKIEADTKVQLLFAAANRDPEVWQDPDDIQLDRFGPGTKPHLAFGWGVHHCIGNVLARREGQLALRWMVETFEKVELIGPVQVNQPFILRGLTTLPIRWTLRTDKDTVGQG